MKLFDAHCHLQFPHYKDDLQEVLSRMQALEMGAIIIGTDFETSRAAVELAEKHDFLWASAGLHPNDNESEAFDSATYEALAKRPKVVAIGECGLDYFRSGATAEERQGQKARFKAHLELAQKLNKPLIIHCRNAHDDCSSILQKTRIGVPVVMHFFTADAEITKKYLDLGCFLSFPGPITYTDMYDESIRLAPLDKILIETDAPFAAPIPNRGARNEPSYVVEVAKKVAAVKNISVEEVAQRTTANAATVFNLSTLLY